MVHGSRAAAGKRGWRGTRRPCRPAPGRAGYRPPPARPGNADMPQHDLELRAVAALPRGDDHRQRLLALLAGQVHLGRQPAAGTAQPVTAGPWHRPAGCGSAWRSPRRRAPAACWCARATVESTGTFQVISPAASARPCRAVRIFRQVPFRCQRREQAIDRLPRPVGLRHVTPRRTGPVRHRIPSMSCRFVRLRRAARLLTARQHRLQHRPLRIRQVRPPRHR